MTAIVIVVDLGLLTALAQAVSPTQRVPDSSSTSPDPAIGFQTVLDDFCVGCHNSRLQTANLNLAERLLEPVGKHADLWEKVLLKLEARSMPPAGRRARPKPSTYDAFASWLKVSLDESAATNPQPGRPSIHRLNRTEYTNAIRDLLALEIDGPSFLPADDLSFGFDNNASLLNISPALMERYVSTAHKISRRAIGAETQTPVAQTYEVARTLVQDVRISDSLPFGSRGGISVEHFFPLEGEYVLRAKLLRDLVGNIYGLARKEHLEFRIDGNDVGTFQIGGDATCGDGSLSAAGYNGCMHADDELSVRIQVSAGAHKIGITFLQRTLAPEGVTPRRLPVGNFTLSSAQNPLESEQMSIGSFTIDGPYSAVGPGNTKSRRRIFTCRPSDSTNQSEQTCAREILRTLVRRAFRRPATESDLATFLDFYETGRQTNGFDAGIQLALTRLLVDPEFLFRIEVDPIDATPGTVYQLTDLELASRLSFFLWSSVPDDELLRLATHGKLSEPTVLLNQVKRMLKDGRSSALVTSFAAQWLHLRNVQRTRPDVNLFPEFDDNLRNAFAKETELLIENQLREDLSLVDLLTANYSFINERLARHYGLSGIYGNRFRRVFFPTHSGRGGLLGHGSILTVTSHTTRTSPVIRGKWILDNILGAPPPPPPDDVPALDENTTGESPRTVRERLEQHRENPVCASCHAQMDPLGFALENFDGIGRWRDSAYEVPIDASATLPDGTVLNGPAELRSLLSSRREAFVRTVTAKLLTYALGRGLNANDKPAIRQIVRDASPDFRWSSIILGITQSVPFTMRSSGQ